MHGFKKITIILFLILLLASVLRLYSLDKFPPSLYTDEASFGYNAYSIMLTGKDEHGIYLPVSLRSFGDWKPPLPAYLMIPTIYLFGLTEKAIRLPSAILGILSILLTFFLAREILAENTKAGKIALIASFILAVNPRHIFLSRSALPQIYGLFYLEAGIYTYLLGLKNNKFFILSFILFPLSFYAYQSLRVISPVIFFSLVFFKKPRFISKSLIVSSVAGLILIMPIFLAFKNNNDVIFGRARTLSIFYDPGVKSRQWELITQDISSPVISRFFHNNFYMFSRAIFEKLLSHFDTKFLFFQGDTAPPFQIPDMGIFYIADSVFILLGFVILFKEKYQYRFLIILWLFISLLPASLTFQTQSGYRSFNMILPFIFLISIGVLKIFYKFKSNILLYLPIIILYSLSFYYFTFQYFIVLPEKYSKWWNYGWKEIVNFTQSHQVKYPKVVASDVNGMPYIYFLFYTRYDPSQFQKGAIRNHIADRFGYEHISSFGRYSFLNNFSWTEIKSGLKPQTLYITEATQAPFDDDYIKGIYYPDGRLAYKIFAYGKK